MGPACHDCSEANKPRCSNCFLIIHDELYNKFNRYWHVDCFTCKVCEKKVDPAEFTGHENWPVHTECWKEKYARKCAHCKKIIWGDFMKISTFDVHVDCSKEFVDILYNTPIDEGPMMRSKEQEEFESLFLKTGDGVGSKLSSEMTGEVTGEMTNPSGETESLSNIVVPKGKKINVAKTRKKKNQGRKSYPSAR